MIRNVPSEKPVLLKDIINVRENQIISKVLTDSEHIHMTQFLHLMQEKA